MFKFRVEKNATAWSKEKFSSLFKGITWNGQSSDGKRRINILITDVSDVKGFADVHNRKNQLKFLYDFDHIHLTWTATLDPPASEIITGKIEIEDFNCTSKLDSLEVITL